MRRKFRAVLCAVCAAAVLLPMNPIQGGAYEGATYNVRFITKNGTRRATFIQDTKDGGGLVGEVAANQWDWRLDTSQALIKDAEPNTVTPLKTIPQGQIHILQIDADLCGAAIEPVEGKSIVLEGVGLSDQKDISVSTSVSGETLKIQLQGKTGKVRYVNFTPGNRRNTIRIGIPKDILQKAEFTVGTAFVLMDGLNLPVTASTSNGTFQVKGTQLTQPIACEAANGTILIEGDTVGSTVQCKAANGTVSLQAGAFSGEAVMSALNGDVIGRVSELLGNFHGEVKNGDISFHFEKQPENLTLHADTYWDADTLPAGWRDGQIWGNGKPTLTLKKANGDIQVTCGKNAVSKEKPSVVIR